MKRNRLRRTAASAACVMLLQTAALLPVHAADSYIFHDTFDSSDCGWTGRGGASVKTVSEPTYAGSGALAVTGRSEEWNGAQKDVSSIMETGKTYALSACAYFESGSKPVDFMLSLTYKDANGDPVYDHIANAETAAGFYVQLYSASYTLPSGATDPVLYVETKTGSTSFIIDEVICAPEGTEIEGPAPVKFTLGDVDFDGTITAADLSLAKTYAGKTFPNKNMQKAADVDQSGTVDAADIQWLHSFVMTKGTEYPEPVKPPKSDYIYDAAIQPKEFPDKYLETAAHPGKVIEEKYDGTTGTNTCYVYLPPDYDESKQYNIFYLMHGGGENEKTLFFQKDTMMQNIFDHMIENGELEPLIVVTPTWNQCGAENFWKELREKCIPHVEGKYSTYAASTSLEDIQASRYHRAYGGFSMGSISTWGVFMHDLDIIAYYMPLSGEYKVNNLSVQDQAKLITGAITDSGLQPNQYFILAATGSDDMAQPNMTPLINELKKYDQQLIYTSDLSEGNFYYMVQQGKTHWWGWVRHYVYTLLPTFFHEDNG